MGFFMIFLEFALNIFFGIFRDFLGLFVKFFRKGLLTYCPAKVEPVPSYLTFF